MNEGMDAGRYGEAEIGIDLKVRFHCYSESCGLPHGFCRPVREGIGLIGKSTAAQ